MVSIINGVSEQFCSGTLAIGSDFCGVLSYCSSVVCLRVRSNYWADHLK